MKPSEGSWLEKCRGVGGGGIFKWRQASLQFSENSVQVTKSVLPITGMHFFVVFVSWCLIVESRAIHSRRQVWQQWKKIPLKSQENRSLWNAKEYDFQYQVFHTEECMSSDTGASLNYPSLCAKTTPQAAAASLWQMKSRKCFLQNVNHVRAGSSNQSLEVMHSTRRCKQESGIHLLGMEFKSRLGKWLIGPLDKNAIGNCSCIYSDALWGCPEKGFAIGT